MTEADWLACADPSAMLLFLKGKASARKLRLFACECVRHIWQYLRERRLRKLVGISERYADGLAQERGLRSALVAAQNVQTSSCVMTRGPIVRTAAAAVVGLGPALNAEFVTGIVADVSGLVAQGDALRRTWKARAAVREAECEAAFRSGRDREKQVLADLLREIFGNPISLMAFETSWRSPATLAIARTAYEDRRFEDFPLLADALEEAGCANPDILSHCRGPGPHGV
jgi:hypothetical protein